MSAEGPSQSATPVTVPTPPQVPVGRGTAKVSFPAKMASGLLKFWALKAWQLGVLCQSVCVSVGRV